LSTLFSAISVRRRAQRFNNRSTSDHCRGRKSGNDTRQYGQGGHVQQHATVNCQLGHPKKIGRCECEQRIEAPAGQRDAERPSCQRKQNTFDEQLPHDDPTPGPEGCADRDFVLA
jgi:hypothetical protein